MAVIREKFDIIMPSRLLKKLQLLILATGITLPALTFAEPSSYVIGAYMEVDSTKDAENVASLAGNGTCELREAIAAFNSGATVDACVLTISPQLTTIVIKLAAYSDDIIYSLDAPLIIDNPNGHLLIYASGQTKRLISASNHFQVNADTHLELHDMMLSDGSGGQGGSVTVAADSELTTNNVQFLGNTATQGGAIYSLGELSLFDTDFYNNSADDGGAIFSSGWAQALQLDFSNNAAGANGGAIYIDIGSELIASGLGFYRNSAPQGCAVYVGESAVAELGNAQISENCGEISESAISLDAYAQLSIRNVNLTNNAGFALSGDYISAYNSVLQDNGGDNCANYLSAAAYNWISDDSCTGSSNGNVALSSLADKGGPLATQIPLPGSSLLNAGDYFSSPAFTMEFLPPLSSDVMDIRKSARSIATPSDIGAANSIIDLNTGPISSSIEYRDTYPFEFDFRVTEDVNMEWRTGISDNQNIDLSRLKYGDLKLYVNDVYLNDVEFSITNGGITTSYSASGITETIPAELAGLADARQLDIKTAALRIPFLIPKDLLSPTQRDTVQIRADTGTITDFGDPPLSLQEDIVLEFFFIPKAKKDSGGGSTDALILALLLLLINRRRRIDSMAFQTATSKR